MKRFFLMASAAALLLLVACSPGGNPPGEAPAVYGSTHPVTEFTKYIAGDKMAVKSFAPSGGDLHAFEPSAQDMRSLQGAKAFFYDGLGAEPYLPHLESNTPNLPFVRVAPTQGLIHPDDTDTLTDPHIWLSPRRAGAEMGNIASELARLDPENASVYQANLQEQQSKIDQLDASFQKLSGQTFVVTHNAYSYLAKDYGITFYGIGADAHGEPTPAQTKQLVDYCQQNNIQVIYRGANEPEALARTIAQQAGLQIRILDSFESDNGEDYFTVMNNNYQALAGE